MFTLIIFLPISKNRMKGLLKLSSLLLIFCVACNAPKQENYSLTEKLDSLFASWHDYSGVVLLADKGKPVYHKAFGFLNLETKTPADTSSIFELASVSKQFTAMVIMMVKEEGKLQYDDPIEKYIPGLPYPGITIRHLLNHTSGLPDYQQIMDQHWDKNKVAGNEDIISYLIQYYPARLAEPGEKYEYSNTGYVLLASIAEKASGKDFVEFCRERIFKPLNMTSTDIRSLDEKAAIKNFALGHLYVQEKQRYIRADSFPSSNYTIWLGNRKGPGRISSTASDLLKWDRAVYTEKLINKETLKEAFTPAKLNSDSISNYGFGWDIESSPAFGKVVRHSGDNPGYKTHIIRYIDADKTVILFSNNAHEQFEEVLKTIEIWLNG
jgi:CubicO group peptidase (beta-lactamase class C family)